MHTPPLILVADDEADVLEVLETICRRAGYAVAFARDGHETLSQMHKLMPDLLLLDIQMPGISGWEVLEKLKQDEKTAQLPVIVITAAATRPTEVAQGINLGAGDYVTKPFHYHELQARISAKIRAKSLEESLQQRTNELESLVRLGIDLNRPIHLESLAENLLSFLLEQMNADVTTLYIWSQQEQGLVKHYSLSRNGIQAGPKFQVERHQRKKISVLNGDTPSEASRLLAARQAQEFIHPEMQDGIIAPLLHHNQPLGFLLVGCPKADHYTEHDLRLLDSVSRQAALAIRNAQLYEELRGYAEELEHRVEQRTEQLLAAQERLVRSEKLASLGRLAREVAHEINNPLQPIMTILEGALEDLEARHPVNAEDLNHALQEVQRAKRTIKRLQDFAKPDSGGAIDLNPKALMEEILALVGRQLEKQSVRLSSRLNEVPLIHANPDQIKQVFLNLIINAVDAMEGKRTPRLDITLWHEQDQNHITVRDNGIGIPPENLSTIFEPFFTSKPDGGGIGLAVSHSIVEAYGGTIEVQSTPGKGTEFKVSLPVVSSK